ncbi:MAG: PIN domain-containing protein [Candidatus Dormibacteria bacterium]
MRYLLDTDTLSALLKPRPNLVLGRRLATEPAESIFTSAITAAELVYGAARSGRPQLVGRVETVLDALPIVSFDAPSAYVYGRLRAELQTSGTNLAEPDLRIASIAMAYQMVVVTGNGRHFARVPGLQLEDWLG